MAQAPSGGLDHPRGHPWLAAALFALAYFLAALAGKLLSFQPLNFIVLWLPSGLFAAALLCSRTRRWPFIAAVAFATNICFDLANGQQLATSLGFAAANCLEAVSGALLARRFGPPRPATHVGRRELLAVIGGSVVAGPALGAALGASVVGWAFGSGDWFGTWLTWWSADALSVVALGIPLVAAHRFGRSYLRGLAWGRLAEFGVLMVVLCILTWRVFGHQGGAHIRFVLLPVLLWASIRFRLLMVGLAGLAMSCLAMFLTAHAVGGEAVSSLAKVRELQAVQGYLGIAISCMMLLASTLNSQKRTAAALRASEGRLALALQATSEGLWDLDVRSGETYLAPATIPCWATGPASSPIRIRPGRSCCTRTTCRAWNVRSPRRRPGPTPSRSNSG